MTVVRYRMNMVDLVMSYSLWIPMNKRDETKFNSHRKMRARHSYQVIFAVGEMYGKTDFVCSLYSTNFVYIFDGCARRIFIRLFLFSSSSFSAWCDAAIAFFFGATYQFFTTTVFVLCSIVIVIGIMYYFRSLINAAFLIWITIHYTLYIICYV